MSANSPNHDWRPDIEIRRSLPDLDIGLLRGITMFAVAWGRHFSVDRMIGKEL